MKLAGIRTNAVLTLLVFFVVGFTSAPNVQAQDQPNILLILVDDLGYGDLRSFGSKDMQTPNIDALVNGGLRFNNFYANSSVCSPTRASLLTGRYPELVGVPGVIRTDSTNSWGHLHSKAAMLPALLKKGGYQTALIGKWHLGLQAPNLPNEKGFDFFHGFLGDMMDDYYSHLRHNRNYMRLNDQEIKPQGHATDLFTQWAVDYLESKEARKAPFFLYLAYNAPHDPIQPPTEWIKKVQVRQPGMSDKRAKLVAFIEHLDAGIGSVIQSLKRSGLYNNTLIVFTSDNGGRLDLGANNGALRSGKGSMYEGGLKVPAAILWSQKMKQGRVSNSVQLTMDLFPTMLDAAGVAYDKQSIDGVSFYPMLIGGEEVPSDRPVFFIRREGDAEYGGKTIDAVRKGNWKLLQNTPFSPRELYNLQEDPLEQHNLIEAQKEKFRELSALQRLQVQKGGAVPWQP